MRLTYPPVTETSFSDAALAFKIARHTPCSACDTCHGLRPPPDTQVVLDDQDSRKSSLGALDQYGSDEDDEPAYLCTCICGHEVGDHGAEESVVGREEFSRRGDLAILLDAKLQAMDKLLDFDYSDDDILSLRQQIKLRESPMPMHSPSIGKIR
ncbi:hypothetical protein OG21DRAFT_1409723 [Imleria badia]|nr:hypothetical protein OG21DRAFT_1409723 [Imleria badia]